MQTRSFGADPERVASTCGAGSKGARTPGALACAKHFPGHGRTTVDSHIDLPVVDASAETLRESDLVPFARGRGGRCRIDHDGHVAYPALDPSGLPATLSKPILDELRGRWASTGWSCPMR